MAQNDKVKVKTLYEVLGVPRTAKATDIGLAYQRYKAKMQEESAVPDARRAALMKMAYETLYDPARRGEYDATLEAPRRKKRSTVAAIAAAVVAAVAAGGAYKLLRTPDKPARAAALTPQQLLEAASPFVGRLQGTVMSGEVKPAGVAVAIAEGEMITTCHALPAGAQLSVLLPTGWTKAEITRSNVEQDVCTLKVKEIGAAFMKMRGAEPGPTEKVYAIVAEGSRPNQLKETRVAKAIADPKGAVLELKAPGPFPTGTPLIDAQGRLVGLVTSPHSFGEGLTVALGPSRIAQARAGGPISSTPDAAAASVSRAADSVEPAVPAARGAGPVLVAEGFTTLWKEDSAFRTIEVLDNPKKGQVGAPLGTGLSGPAATRGISTTCTVSSPSATRTRSSSIIRRSLTSFRPTATGTAPWSASTPSSTTWTKEPIASCCSPTAKR